MSKHYTEAFIGQWGWGWQCFTCGTEVTGGIDTIWAAERAADSHANNFLSDQDEADERD